MKSFSKYFIFISFNKNFKVLRSVLFFQKFISSSLSGSRLSSVYLHNFNSTLPIRKWFSQSVIVRFQSQSILTFTFNSIIKWFSKLLFRLETSPRWEWQPFFKHLWVLEYQRGIWMNVEISLFFHYQYLKNTSHGVSTSDQISISKQWKMKFSSMTNFVLFKNIIKIKNPLSLL